MIQDDRTEAQKLTHLLTQSAKTIKSLMDIMGEWSPDTYQCAYCGGEFELEMVGDTYNCPDADCPGNVAAELLNEISSGTINGGQHCV
jgi:hypothetical protein